MVLFQSSGLVNGRGTNKKGSSPISKEKEAEFMKLGLFAEIKSIPLPDPEGFRKDECAAYLDHLVTHYDNLPDVL